MKSSKLAYLYEFPKFLKEIKKLNDIIFFFPFYHFGGGETVHLDILKIFKDYKTSCFIIHESDNDFLREDFLKVTNIVDLWKYKSSKYNSYLKSLARVINSKDNPIVFGCNNRFFYQLAEYLDEDKVKILDLTHAFSYEDPHAVEKFSLPMVHKIRSRVILGKKTYDDYKSLYIDNNVDLSLLNRFVIINNAVDIPDSYTNKLNDESLKVLFVSRNSFEKRPEILFEIAKRCHLKKIKASFTVIGDFENVTNNLPNLKIAGSIKEKEKLNSYYSENDTLLITSFREGFPMVILEGMAFGVVPISTNVGEISSFINSKNNNGILLNDISINRYRQIQHTYEKNEKWYPANQLKNIPTDLEKIIDEFVITIEKLQNNRSLLSDLSINAYNSINENFSKDKHRKEYLNLFSRKG